MGSPNASRSPPRVDDLDILDEALEDRTVDLIEYLEREDNPDPDYHPPVQTGAGGGGDDGLPIAEPRSPPPGPGHEHTYFCPYKWKPPSLKPIYRQPGRRQRLTQAGILNFIAYNYPKVKKRFFDEEWRDINWSEDLQAIVVTPTILSLSVASPRQVITVAYLQRIWPGLPSRESHRADVLAIAPAETNAAFYAQALLRYWALTILQTENEGRLLGIALDTCFHTALYRFLLRLAYIFGWRGYGLTFPTKYLPISIMTFVSGAYYPWADLLLRELIYDIKHRRRCPSLVRVWKAIWDFVLAESRNQPHIPPLERRYLHQPLLREARDEDIPYTQIGVHYHLNDISPHTPASFRDVVERGACRRDDCDIVQWPGVRSP